jgi:hypothetical protein
VRSGGVALLVELAEGAEDAGHLGQDMD